MEWIIVSLKIGLKKRKKNYVEFVWLEFLQQNYGTKYYIFASLTEINYDTLFIIMSAEDIIISTIIILKILNVNSFFFVYGQSVSD